MERRPRWLLAECLSWRCGRVMRRGGLKTRPAVSIRVYRPLKMGTMTKLWNRGLGTSFCIIRWTKSCGTICAAFSFTIAKPSWPPSAPEDRFPGYTLDATPDLKALHSLAPDKSSDVMVRSWFLQRRKCATNGGLSSGTCSGTLRLRDYYRPAFLEINSVCGFGRPPERSGDSVIGFNKSKANLFPQGISRFLWGPCRLSI